MFRSIFLILSTLSLIVTVSCVLLMPVEWIKEQVNTESYLIEESLGDAYPLLEEQMLSLYRTVVYETGLHNYVTSMFGEIEAQKIKDIGMNTEYQLFQYVQRILVIKYWIPYFLVVAAALIIDAMGVRSIKRHTFKFPDTKIFHLSMYVVTFSVLGLFVFLNLPVTVSQPVYFPMYLLLVMAGAIHVMLRNYQKVE